MRRRATLCGFFLLIAAQAASAAEITQRTSDNAETTAIELKGRIERGDLLSLQALISKLPQTKSMAVYLNSTAGSLDESIALGRFFHQAKMRTVIAGSPTKCLISCALAFLGGRDAATGKPLRVKTSSGQLGFYSFQFTATDKTEYTDKDMTTAVVNTQRMVLRIADYIQEIREDLGGPAADLQTVRCQDELRLERRGVEARHLRARREVGRDDRPQGHCRPHQINYATCPV